MRVTLKSLNRHVTDVINTRYGELTHTQEMLSTGRRLLRPSDSPIDTANDIKLKTRSSQLTQYSTNISDGMSFMSVSDTAMTSMNILLQRMRELAIRGSNDTLSAKERGFIQKETEQLLRQVISLTNTNYKGDYVFAGTQSKIEPFPMKSSTAATVVDYQQRTMASYNAGAGPGTYQLQDSFYGTAITNLIPGSFELKVGATQYTEGVDFSLDYNTGMITIVNPAIAVDVSDGGLWDAGAYYRPGQFDITFEYIGQGKNIYGDSIATDGNVLREIEPGTVTPINIPGQELLRDPTTGINMLDSLVKFNQNLLYNNRAGIGLAITEIDVMFKTLLAAESKNGARMNRFDTTLTRNENQSTETTRLQSELEDADFAETASKFTLMETIYNAALKSSAKVIQPSLLDYL